MEDELKRVIKSEKARIRREEEKKVATWPKRKKY